MYIPPTFGLAAFVCTEGIDDVGTEPFVWTLGIGLGVATEYVAIADALKANWEENLAPTTTDLLYLTHVSLTVPVEGGGTGTVNSTGSSINGELSGDALFLSMSAKVRKSTDRLGRKGRGLCHPPGVLGLGEVTSGGAVINTARERVDDAFEAFALQMLSDSLFPALLHTDEADGAPDAIIGFSTMPSVGVIRKRIVS